MEFRISHFIIIFAACGLILMPSAVFADSKNVFESNLNLTGPVDSDLPSEDTTSSFGTEPFMSLSSDNPLPDSTIGIKSLSIPSVPVPPALWILGSGLIGLVGIRRKIQK